MKSKIKELRDYYLRSLKSLETDLTTGKITLGNLQFLAIKLTENFIKELNEILEVENE